MKIKIINGPNLNLLGTRETEIYGSISMVDYLVNLQDEFKDHQIELYQSNIEGELVNALQDASAHSDAIIINPAAYSHTSVAITDCIANIKTPIVEVHISNIHAREEYRSRSITASKVNGVITGFGLESYRLAMKYLISTH